TPSLQFNAEGRYHSSRYSSSLESSALPSNFFLRADSGKIGKFSIAGWTSKRDIMPVYSSERAYGGSSDNAWSEEFKPSLRYFGDMKNTGVTGSYEFNKDHSISFTINDEESDLKRYNKSASDIGSVFEPMQVYNRSLKRSTYNFIYKGRGGTTDWQVNVNHGKEKEKDVTLLNSGNGTQYSGGNTLASVDWLEHEQTTVGVDLHTAVNDAHYLSYGFGHTREWAEGTRLRNAPKTRVQTINPWDYDKSLGVKENTGSGKDVPNSYVHNFEYKRTDGGFMWDKDKEFYGNDKPAFTYDDAKNMDPELKAAIVGSGYEPPTITDEMRQKYGDIVDRYAAFNEAVSKQNGLMNADGTPNVDKLMEIMAHGGSMKEFFNPGLAYYGQLPKADGSNYEQDKNLLYNGKYYGQGYDERDNQVSVGEAEINRYYAYLQDDWQLNDTTVLTPSLRLDHSDLFGSHVTGNIGLLHNVNGNEHRRFKANVGTGYAEPGMGELYYNWEMFGASGSHLGWYWVGNPDLKPEKSLNFDLSIEGENDKTYAKVGVFHNEIKDYMSSYFTGQLIDFDFNNVYGTGLEAYHPGADRIYSFRNIGKAKITGLEAEVQQKFNDNWSMKLGYTWLHAINSSDKDMPHRLLDRPTQKFDLSLNYRNTKGDWRAAIWGSYYVNMLDSNSVSTESLFEKDDNGNYIRKQGKYAEKSFGIWNVMVEKDFGKDFTAYVGVDNVFNHQDDDRAFADRTYRFGVNIKLDDLSDTFHRKTSKTEFVQDKDGNTVVVNKPADSWFITRPASADTSRKAGDVQLYGDYQLRSNMYKGQDKVAMRQTKDTQPTDAAVRNHADKAAHGLEQRLRLGVDYQLADGLNLNVLGSTAKDRNDYNVADKRGLHDPYLEKAELTKSTQKWDWTVGRITEPMGVTGYYFGKYYDGVRVAYSNKNTQVIAGYGDFSQSTGVSDSAYNHKRETIIQRAPTISEFLGIMDHAAVPGLAVNPAGQYNYASKFDNAKTPEEKLQVMKEFVHILKDINDASVREYSHVKIDQNTYYKGFWGNESDTATFVGHYADQLKNRVGLDLKATVDGQSVDLGGTYTFESGAHPLAGLSVTDMFDADIVKGRIRSALQKLGATAYQDRDNGQTLTLDQAVDHAFASYVGDTTSTVLGGSTIHVISNLINDLVSARIGNFGYLKNKVLNNGTVPMPGVPLVITQKGYLLDQDQIPAMDRAGYIKLRHQLSDTVGVEAWKLNSFGEGAYDDQGHEMKIADVIGVGSQIRLGDKAMLSFDYGQNRAAMGRYFHGGMGNYGEYTGGGSTPDFWVARLDIGRADTDVPGSWNAFLDYKSFDHGAFLGGNGTASLPDRYLDGIRSFTAGIGYVPSKNLLLEAFYTFDAHSTQTRDTLYTPESFDLGDYTRIQATYKF
ncbi:TonB-dependent siderophore receptor, partial [uncultured Megasphaera sp.]|uniref:TonB-dependent receptor plug domain-containing protein n=1 Tax=uncultured Megasphaera sp. TaxID=165188 RepID=UPI00265B15AC